MANCTSCGADVTGKKFCPECGTPVQPPTTPTADSPSVSPGTCPRCNGEVKPGAAFCMHCGSALSAPSMVAHPSTRTCPNCRTEVPIESAFCNNCGQNMRVSTPPVSPAATAPTPSFCTNCGHQNNPGVHFCAACGKPLAAASTPPTAQPQFQQQVPYPQQPQYPQQPPPYGQPQYPQQPSPYGQSPYQQPYGQPQYQQPYGGYQQDPMLGQQPMALHCPTCMTPSAVGTPYCPRCNTSLAGIVPTPANYPVQGQQGGIAGFLQGSGGKMAMGAVGGAAAVIGGEMLLHGIENSIENRVEGDMGYGGEYHHHRQYDDQGNPLGEIGEIAKDIGLL